MLDEQQREGVIEKVHYCSPDSGFFTGKVRCTTGGLLSVKGTLIAAVGDRVELTGTMVTHPKYGPQFNFTSGRLVLNESREALVTLLATNKRFKGFGPARAEKLVAAAERMADPGEKITDVLTNTPEDLALCSGIPVKMVLLAAEVWEGQRAHFEDITALIDMGWSNVQAAAIRAHFGNGAPGRIGKDPYELIGKVKRFGFLTVDAVARKMGVEKSDPRRIAAGVVFCLTRDQSNGHTWMAYRALLMASLKELQPDTLNGEDLIQDSIDEAVGAGLIFRTQADGEDVVAQRPIAEAEVRVFERLLWGLRHELDPLDLWGGVMGELNAGQRQAVEGFSNTIYSVISGSAGTGKTYIVKAIREISKANGLRIKLCAPTGKAAVRLSEATDAEATTIHQLLGTNYDPETGGFTFVNNYTNRLDAQVIVVDEASMVDPFLMRSLLSAMEDDCRLVLVGDHNQIPSVQAGAILRDVLRSQDSLPRSIHILTEIVRQRGVLARNTSAILDGMVSPHETFDWGFLRPPLNDESKIPDLAASLVEFLAGNHSEELGRVPDIIWDIQLLCPMKAGPMGMNAINARMQALHQGRLGNFPPPPFNPDKLPQPMVGDKVIWTKNNYTLQMMNGQMGVVEKLLKGGDSILSLEDGRIVEVPAKERFSYDLGYAITIHKSQGSQWPYVLLLISESQYMMQDVNLLYTGASRASVSLTFAGTAKGINMFAKNRKSHTRRTFGSLMSGGWVPVL